VQRNARKETRQGANRFEFCLRKIPHTFSPLDSPFGLRESLKISGKTDERTRGVKFLLKIPEETLLCAQRKVSLAPFFGHLSWVSKKGEIKNNEVTNVFTCR
jgi:hypothetical protein